MKRQYADTVFVTGGAGFIGSNYLNKYVPLCPTRLFVNIDCLTYAGKRSNLSVEKEKNYKFHKIDIRDRVALRRLFKAYKPAGIIHFAAESHVDLSIKNPEIFVETNVVGTHNLLSLAREYGVKRFHQISTDEVYGSLRDRKGSFTEKSLLAPRNPYSASKAAADMLVQAYHETFGLNSVITRSGNNYGPNQDASKMIPSFITKLMQGKKVPLYSRGEHIREWIYVEDCVDAIHLVFEKGVAGAVYNISSGVELTNLDLTKKILALARRDKSFIKFVADRPGHDFRYFLDSKKLRKELGWEPKVSFVRGLQMTFDFYKKKTI